VSAQLGQHGLIDWYPINAIGGFCSGLGRISACGIDVVEGTVTSAISINMHDHRSVNVSGSSNVIVGDGNTQNINENAESLIRAINNMNAPSEQKEEAKSLLRNFLEHPLLTALAGGAITLLGGR